MRRAGSRAPIEASFHIGRISISPGNAPIGLRASSRGKIASTADRRISPSFDKTGRVPSQGRSSFFLPLLPALVARGDHQSYVSSHLYLFTITGICLCDLRLSLRVPNLRYSQPGFTNAASPLKTQSDNTIAHCDFEH